MWLQNVHIRCDPCRLEGRTYLSHVPLWNNYNTGDELVAFLLALANNTGVEDASLESLYALIKDDFIEDDRTSTVLSGIGSVSDMKAVAAAGGTAATTSTRRSTEWLEENGTCHCIRIFGQLVGSSEGFICVSSFLLFVSLLIVSTPEYVIQGTASTTSTSKTAPSRRPRKVGLSSHIRAQQQL